MTEGEALGRSRGGLGTKIHLAVDGRGRPLSVLLTGGQAGDNPQLLTLLDAIAGHHGGPGRPRKRPDMLLAAKEHEMHHRAQLMVVERMLGIVPHLTRDMQARMAQMQSAAQAQAGKR